MVNAQMADTRNAHSWTFGFQFDDLFLLSLIWVMRAAFGDHYVGVLFNANWLKKTDKFLIKCHWKSFLDFTIQLTSFFPIVTKMSPSKIDLPITNDAWGVYCMRMYAFCCTIDGNEQRKTNERRNIHVKLLSDRLATSLRFQFNCSIWL